MGDPKGLEALRQQILHNQGFQGDNFNMDECGNLINDNMAEFQKPKNAQMLPYDESTWEVPYDKLDFKQIIGEGHFGKVSKVYMTNKTNEKQTVAVKMLRSNPERIEVEKDLFG